MPTLSLITHQNQLSATPVRTKGIFTQYSIEKNLRKIGEFELPTHMLPRFSVGSSGRVSIYGWTKVFLVHQYDIDVIEEREDVHQVYLLDDSVFSVCDSYISTYNFKEKRYYVLYEHHSIIIYSIMYFSNKEIIFIDIENNSFYINIESYEVKPNLSVKEIKLL